MTTRLFKNRAVCITVIGFLIITLIHSPGFANPAISIVADKVPGLPVMYGLDKLTAALAKKWVHLLYRDVNQYEDFKTLDMKPSKQKDEFEATIPGEEIKSKWDLMYLVEMMDKNKNGTIYPDLNKLTPYVVIKVAH